MSVNQSKGATQAEETDPSQIDPRELSPKGDRLESIPEWVQPSQGSQPDMQPNRDEL